ncbi:hypothetical protein OC844_006225 [Tilletia horrida]|nr:hypothetical protein OC844_006225 [Tilletia horrida]
MNLLVSPERRPYAISNARTSAARMPASRRMLPRSQPTPAADRNSDDDEAGHGSGSVVLRAAPLLPPPPSSPARSSYQALTPGTPAAASAFARGYVPRTPVSPAPPYSPPRLATDATPQELVHHHPAARAPRSYPPQAELAASPARAYRGPLAAGDVLRLLTEPLSKNARSALTAQSEGYLIYFHFLGFAPCASASYSPSERWRCRLCGLVLSAPARKISNLGTHLYGAPEG